MGWIGSGSERGVFLRLLAPSPGEKILDVGAGKGTVAEVVLKEGSEVYALEPDLRRVDSIKKQYPGLKPCLAVAEDIPFSDAFFDKAYATMALHHLEDQPKSLGEIARVLKTGGVLVIVDISPQSLGGRTARFFENSVLRNRFRFLGAAELSELLSSGGRFNAVETVEHKSTYFIKAVLRGS